MWTSITRVLLLAIIVSISACSLLIPKLLPNNDLLLLPPAEGPPSDTIKKRVSIINNGQAHTFIVVAKNTPEIFKVAVVLPTGQNVLSMNYNGQQFKATNYTDIPIPAEEILAIMQFALWPTKILYKYYNINDGWHLFTQVNQRSLLKQTTPIVEMSAQNNKIEIQHSSPKYTVIIEPLKVNAN